MVYEKKKIRSLPIGNVDLARIMLCNNWGLHCDAEKIFSNIKIQSSFYHYSSIKSWGKD